MSTKIRPRLGHGIYSLPDAAKILDLPLPKLRRWVSGYLRSGDDERREPAGQMQAWGSGRRRGFEFGTLIELFVVAALREQGVPMHVIRDARADLSERFSVDFPFAVRGLLTDGRRILKELDQPDQDSALRLDRSGQTVFSKMVREFCHRIDFEEETELASRYWPIGKTRSVVVDPHHAFGQPTIAGTNIRTSVIHGMLKAGESREEVAAAYELSEQQVKDAERFEVRAAA